MPPEAQQEQVEVTKPEAAAAETSPKGQGAEECECECAQCRNGNCEGCDHANCDAEGENCNGCGSPSRMQGCNDKKGEENKDDEEACNKKSETKPKRMPSDEGFNQAPLKPHSLLHLMGRIFDTPLMIAPEKLRTILSVVGPRLMGGEIEAYMDAPSDRKPYGMTPDGIAVIPIDGTLVARTVGMSAWSGLRSYADITAEIKAAAADPDVTGILLDVDSPGGETNGAFDCADVIYAARKSKPIYAVADSSAFSAAYLLASCANRVYGSRTSGFGSIGVIASHVDETAADEKAGLKYTLVFAGAHKTDLNPHVPLSKGAADMLKAEVNRLYGIFCATVGRNRGVEEKDIAGTEAQIFFGELAVEAGLCDVIATREQAIADLRAAIQKKAQAGAIGMTVETALEIASMCELAGFPEATPALLKQKATVEATRDFLLKKKQDAAAAQESSVHPEMQSHVLPGEGCLPMSEKVTKKSLIVAMAEKLAEGIKGKSKK